MGHQPYLTIEDLPFLKAAVKKAKDAGLEEFEYRTNAGDISPMYVPYAEYVIQYLETQKTQTK